MKPVFFLSGVFIILLLGCIGGDNGSEGANQTTELNQTSISNASADKAAFCGWETLARCTSDSDCMPSGCSSQVCTSYDDGSFITTCEWKNCYDANAYGLRCRCTNSRCRWK